LANIGIGMALTTLDAGATRVETFSSGVIAIRLIT
jgi:hypothetical protein